MVIDVLHFLIDVQSFMNNAVTLVSGLTAYHAFFCYDTVDPTDFEGDLVPSPVRNAQ